MIILLGDCTGHGVSSSMVGSLLNAVSEKYFNELFHDYRTDLFLEKVNKDFMNLHEEENFPEVFVCVVDLVKKEIFYSNANFQLPVYKRNGEVRTFEKASGFFIGFDRESKYERKTFYLEDKDMIFFYSDALPEIKKGPAEELGNEAVKKLAGTFGQGVSRDLAAVKDFIKFQNSKLPLDDDTTVVMLQYLSPYHGTFEVKQDGELEKFIAILNEKLIYYAFPKPDAEKIKTGLRELIQNVFRSRQQLITVFYEIFCDHVYFEVKGESAVFREKSFNKRMESDKMERSEVGSWIAQNCADTFTFSTSGQSAYFLKKKAPSRTVRK